MYMVMITIDGLYSLTIQQITKHTGIDEEQ